MIDQGRQDEVYDYFKSADNDSIESSEVCFIDALTDNEKTVLGTESLNKVIQKILYEVTR